MSSGGSSTTQSTQSSAPWSVAQPYLKQVLSGAQTAYQSGNGFSYPNFSTTVPFSSQTTQAQTGIQNLATSGNPLGTASQSATLGTLNSGGYTPGMTSAASGFQGLATGQQPNAIASNLGNYANGSYVNGGSPEFQQALDTQAGKLTDDINRNYSNAGRYGSSAQTNDLVDQVGNLRTSAMANEIAREQGLQTQAAGMLSGEQQQGIGNQLSAYGSLGNLGATAAGNLATAVGQAPSVYAQQYAPYQQLATVGAQNEDLATRQMQENVDRYNATQQQPWNALSAYNALIGGSGQLGGTTTSKVPAPSPLQGLLGGGLTGASVGSTFGPVGSLIGGGLGGLLGLFG